MVKIHTNVQVTNSNSFIWVEFYCGIDRGEELDKVIENSRYLNEERKKQVDLEIRQKMNMTH